jgi:hypothetical protein
VPVCNLLCSEVKYAMANKISMFFDTIKEPESASRIGVVIKWHVLDHLILRQEFIFEFH